MTKDLSKFADQIAYSQAEGLGIHGLSRLLMQQLRRTIVITDTLGKVISWHSPIEQDYYFDEIIIFPSNVKKIDEIPLSGMTVIKGRKTNFLIWPINKYRTMGYLLILHDKIQDLEKNFINVTCRAIMIEMVRKKELYESIQEYKDDFIRDILFNNYDGFDTALRAGKIWGWDFSLPHVVIVVDVKDKEHFMDNNLRKHIVNKIENIYSDNIVGEVGKLVVIMFPITGMIQHSWKDEIRKFYKRIVEQLDEIPFSIGVGKLFPSTNMLYRSYQQAKVALELGGISKSKGVAFFDELGAVRLFYNQSEQELEEFVDEILGPLIKYDGDKENNLLITLWEYFQADCNITEATKKLFIHGNTLRYRLKKVEELLGENLDDTETRFNVYGSLKVAAMLGKI